MYSNFLGSKFKSAAFEPIFIGLLKTGPVFLNSTPRPKACGITRISLKRIAASTERSLIGKSVTFEANS